MEEKRSRIQVEVRINPRLDNVVENTSTALTVGTKTYTFNRVHLTTSQTQMYNHSVKHLADLFLSGYNSTVLAYGQTGSGKTYTMGMTHEDMSGIVPQALRYLFKTCTEMNCTFIEVYNEEVIDLFSQHKTPLNLREVNGEVTVAGVSEVILKSYNDGIEVLKRGSMERTTKSTNMNSKSSRSHAIFTLFHKSEIDGSFVTSKFSFVDLAGSERLKRTLCAGDRVKEGISINSGLLALGNVISALYKRSSHIPFRDSKLTRILQSCLNGYVLMIACVSSSHADIGETHNTLKYANRAACIETTVRMNIQVDGSRFAMLVMKKEIQNLKVENQMLRARFRKEMHVNVEELMNENRILRGKIDTLGVRGDDRREDLAQEILKSPFVQNLIDENQRLSEEIQRLKDKSNDKDPRLNRIRHERLDSSRRVDRLGSIDSQVKTRCDKNSHVEMKSIHESFLSKRKEYEMIENEERKDKESISNIMKHVDSLEITDTAEVVDVQDKRSSISKIHKKVTFDLEKREKKYALFTPRKERITMSTIVKNKLSGYLPTSLAFFNSLVVFSSIDNKVRQWDDRTTVLFTDDGVRCMEGSEMMLYSTRGLLKSFDTRSGTRPVYAFKSEISSLKSRDNYIYTGHEDGSFTILDNRNSTVILSEKIHSGTIFCIEKIDEMIYTGSRDHTIKCYSNQFTTLSPPHLDSVHGLLSYGGDLVSFGRDCSLKRWRGTQIIKTVPYAHDSWIKCGVAMNDSFVTGSKNGTLRFWDFCDNSVFCVGKLKVGGGVNSILWNGDDLYVGCQSKEILTIACKYEQ